MYERFTNHARDAIQFANQQAQLLNHEYIGTEHILLGLMEVHECVAVRILKNLHVDLQRVRLQVVELSQRWAGGRTPGGLPPVPRAKKVIEYAMDEARRLQHGHVGTEHILLGLVREDQGIAGQVLRDLGVELEHVRREVCRLCGGDVETAAGPGSGFVKQPEEVAVPAACPKCGQARTVRVWFNCVHLCGSEEQEVEAGRAILGGRIEGKRPAWVCLACQPRWMEVHRMALQDLQLDEAKLMAVASQEFDKAAKIRDDQFELRQEMSVMARELLSEKPL